MSFKMKTISYLVAGSIGLSVCVKPMDSAHAFGKAPSTPSSSSTDGILDFALNLAIVYGEMDPRYAPVLTALGIHNADDVKKLLNGDQSGGNFKDIAATLIIMYAQKDAKVAGYLNQAGIHNAVDLRRFLDNPLGDAGVQSLVFDLAYQSAAKNPKYAQWLDVMNIHSGEDLGNLIKNGQQGGGLQNMLLPLALAYVQNNPKYAKWVPLIQAVILKMNPGSSSGGSTGGDDADWSDVAAGDEAPAPGAFAGLDSDTLKSIKKCHSTAVCAK